jgi:hypothetical protein
MKLVDLIRAGTPIDTLKTLPEAREWLKRCVDDPKDISPIEKPTERGILGGKHLVYCQGCGIEMYAGHSRKWCVTCKEKMKREYEKKHKKGGYCKKCGVTTQLYTRVPTHCRNCGEKLSTLYL